MSLLAWANRALDGLRDSWPSRCLRCGGGALRFLGWPLATTLIAWGAFAFGAVYSWAYWPLIAAAVAVALTGFLAGIAGFMSLAYYASTTISAHTTDNLNAIAATVMGGTSLFGGIGSVLGTVIGVFIPAVLKKGFNITHVQDFWQMIAVGAVLIAAVWFDQQRRRKRNSR